MSGFSSLKMARVRYQIARKVLQRLLGTVAGSLPGNSVRTVEEAVHRPGIKPHLVAMHHCHGPEIALYPFPDGYPASFRRTKVFETRYIYHLADVICSPHSGLVWTPGGLVLEEGVGVVVRIMGWGGNVPELLLPRQTLADLGPDRPYMVCPAVPFYHFIWEILPVLQEALALYPNLQLLAPAKLPGYIKNALALLLGPQWQARTTQADNACRVSNLIMPQVEVYSGFVHPAYLQNLPAYLLPLVNRDLGNQPTRPENPLIYLSRRLTPRRNLGYELELEQALQAEGFLVVYAEKLSLAEQISLFAQARVVVSPHGAGLSHIGFCRQAPQVVEIFPHDFFNDCYARMTLALGGGYQYQICKVGPNGQSMIDTEQIVLAARQAMAQAGTSQIKNPQRTNQ